MLSGVAENFLIVALGPLRLISGLYIMLILEPSGSVPSTIGCLSLTGLPIRSLRFFK